MIATSNMSDKRGDSSQPESARRHDALSLISTHQDEEGHKFNWDNTEIIAKGNTRYKREFIEALYSNTETINKHIDIDPIYQPLRTKQKERQQTRRNHIGVHNQAHQQ